MLAFHILFACSQQTTKDIDSSVDSPSDTSLEDTQVDTQTLNGTLPEEALTAIEFSALNHDGTPRGRDNLIGQPTVMWFFPMANTPG